jgi:hypothetical protein
LIQVRLEKSEESSERTGKTRNSCWVWKGRGNLIYAFPIMLHHFSYLPLLQVVQLVSLTLLLSALAFSLLTSFILLSVVACCVEEANITCHAAKGRERGCLELGWRTLRAGWTPA